MLPYFFSSHSHSQEESRKRERERERGRDLVLENEGEAGIGVGTWDFTSGWLDTSGWLAGAEANTATPIEGMLWSTSSIAIIFFIYAS